MIHLTVMLYFSCSVDKRKGLSPDYLFVIKSGWTE